MQMVAKIGKNKSKPTNKVVKKKALKLKKPNVSKNTKASSKPLSYKAKPSTTKAKIKSKAKSSVTNKPIAKPTKKITKNIAKPAQSKKSVINKKVQYKAKSTHKAVVKQNNAAVLTKSTTVTKKPLSKPTHKEHDNHLLKHENINISNQQNDLSNLENSALSGPSKFKPYHIDVTEGYMNEQQLRHFANILEAWRQELMMEVDNTITEMKEADILADPNDRATQEETFNLELRTRDRERKLIKKIEAALTKINEQRYGYCDTCGVEIGVRRLEARPTATLCIECKTLAEIREKRA